MVDLPEPVREGDHARIPLGGVELDDGDYTVALLDGDGAPRNATTSDPGFSIAGRAAYISRARTRDLRVYRAPCGALRLRARSVVAYAEVDRVEVADRAGQISVTGVLACADREPGRVEASLLARQRDNTGKVGAPAELADGAFRGTIDLAPLAEAHDLERAHNEWDLWLRTAAGTLRLGAHADDIQGKKQRVVYPERALGGTDPLLCAHPYYTVDDNLSILLRPHDPAKGAV